MKELNVVDSVTVYVLVDNTTDMLSSKPKHITSELQVLMEAGMDEMTGEGGCCALHGLSLLIKVQVGVNTHTLLFDGGPESYGIERNSSRMGLNLGEVDAMFLSHGHFDHSEGLPAALKLIRAASGDKKIPFYVHPEAFHPRGLKVSNGEILPIKDVPSIAEFTSLGADVITSKDEETILDHTFYISGEIARESFEVGYRNHYQKTAAGEWVEDQLVLDERYVAVNVKGKGIIIFTGCSHAGIINIINDVTTRFAGIPMYAIVGGLHLTGINEDRIEKTVSVIEDYGFKYLVVGHCTGWRAIHALVDRFGEEVVDPLVVGTRHIF